MANQDLELAEVSRRASTIVDGVLDAFATSLRVTQAQHAAERKLGGGTVKAVATIARDSIRLYFQELETYVQARPAGKPGFDGIIVDGISASTKK